VPRTPSSMLGSPNRFTRSDLNLSYRPLGPAVQRPRRAGASSSGDDPLTSGSGGIATGSGPADPRSAWSHGGEYGSTLGGMLPGEAGGTSSAAGLTDLGEQAGTIVWGTTINVARTLQRFSAFFESFLDPVTGNPLYPSVLEEVVLSGNWSLNLNAKHLFEFEPDLYRDLIFFPGELIPLFDAHVHNVAKERFPELESAMRRIQIKPFNLLQARNMRLLNPDDIDTLVSIKGMVIRCGDIIPELRRAFFQCSRCNNPHVQDVENGQVQEPVQCPRCKQRHTMQLIHNRSFFADKQLIKIQETPDEIPDGETPHTVTIFAHDDLVDIVKPGDRVEVTGVFRAQPVRVNPRRRTVRTVFRTFVDAVHFKKIDNRKLNAPDTVDASMSEAVTEYGETDATRGMREEEEQKILELSRDPNIYERLVASTAPSIYEMDDVKKGILCMLFGGTNNEGAASGRFRGEINILLCGDPGTSKSQLLQYTHKLAPRGIYTSGKGSSAVGLTAYIARDPVTRELVLESGALVLSDRGVCCIDEFDKMNDSARSILHEVMEQQTVSIAKAGIVCTLNARTSILASANPKQSRYNPKLSVVRNIELGPTLLSRFDLIYLILDQPDPNNDRRLARHLVSMYYPDEDLERENVSAQRIPTELLAQYIAYAKKHIHPEISDEASAALVAAYVSMRRVGHTESKKIITATPRQLESLIRLSEALARMKFKRFVGKEEVDEAVRLMNVATQTAATDPTTGRIDMELLTTGKSSLERRKVEQMREVLHKLLQGKLTGARRHPQIPMEMLLAEFNAQISSVMLPISMNEFRPVVQELASEGFLEINKGRGGGPETVKVLGDQLL